MLKKEIIIVFHNRAIRLPSDKNKKVSYHLNNSFVTLDYDRNCDKPNIRMLGTYKDLSIPPVIGYIDLDTFLLFIDDNKKILISWLIANISSMQNLLEKYSISNEEIIQSINMINCDVWENEYDDLMKKWVSLLTDISKLAEINYEVL